MVPAEALEASRPLRLVTDSVADQEAPARFEDVYRAHAAGIYRFCLSQLRDPAVAEDVAAEVFADAYAAWGRFDPGPDGVRPWLYRIARNAACDELRRRGRRPTVALGEAVGSPVDIERAVGVRAELRAVMEAMGRLRERDRLLLGLRLAAGLSHAETAAVLGIGERAAVVATGRALERLRALLAAEGWR